MHSDSIVLSIGSVLPAEFQSVRTWQNQAPQPMVSGSMRDLGLSILWYLLRVLATLAYFFPTIAASRYRHPRQLKILYLTILLGWTVVGWAIALQWALQASKRPGSMERS